MFFKQELRQEKKMAPDRIIRRVKKRGYGENDRYIDKLDSKCYTVYYWKDDPIYYVSWEKNKFQMIVSKLILKLKTILKRGKK